MKSISILSMLYLLTSCLTPFDKHAPVQDPELLPLFLEIQDSLLIRNIKTDVLFMDIVLRKDLISNTGKKGRYNTLNHILSIDEDWFYRMMDADRNEVLATGVHELGHSLGLTHVSYPHVMAAKRPAMDEERLMTQVYDELSDLYHSKND